ncbi:hypothetical protein Blue_026 [Bacillus phage Deep Blue]|uniref:Uncharacterized protein n=1 Tax=Bacillus phage Deep Blue TaxID=1792245 RepID=A0A140HLI7_9CAUD|nr:hypothetical protein Blue_026 [Bacillus phage Deep Blue]AMO25849.1 hypothetical protein Blue_026 [Bacillus phage Deep Blue]
MSNEMFIPLREIESLIGQLEDHAETNQELLDTVKEPTLKARLEGKQMTYDYTIKKLELIVQRSR